MEFVWGPPGSRRARVMDQLLWYPLRRQAIPRVGDIERLTCKDIEEHLLQRDHEAGVNPPKAHIFSYLGRLVKLARIIRKLLARKGIFLREEQRIEED